jgi:gliding motility-associated-like protein
MFFAGNSFSQSIFISTGSGTLWKSNPNTCTSVLIGSCPTFVDIAFLPNGKLYGQTWGAIYEVDTNTAASTLIMSVATGNSMVGAPNGMLYAVSGTTLREIDVTTLTATVLGNVNCSSGGDLAFFDGSLHMACSGNNLLKIDISNPGASFNVGNMSISGAAWGLINAVNGCTENPYVISSSGNLYDLDYTNANTGTACNLGISGSVYGGASPNEFAATGGNTNIFGPDTTLCNIASITYTLPILPNTVFLWNDNSTNNSITISTDGKYWVDVTDTIEGCTFTDTVNVAFVINNMPDTIFNICTPRTINLQDSINPPPGAIWYDNTYSVITPSLFLSTGSYTFYYSSPLPCVDTATVIVNILYDTIHIGNDTTLCVGQTVNYGIPSAPNFSYLWSDNTNTSINNIGTSGKYYLIAANNIYGCILSDTASVTVLPIPNAGVNNSITFCDYNGIDLYNHLNGTPDIGGTWVNNDGTTVTIPISVTNLYNSPYSYIVNNGFCSDTATISTTNIIPDLIGFTYSPQYILSEQTDVIFTQISSADSVKWLVDNIEVGSTNTYSQKFLTNGFFNVCLVVYTDNCIDTICQAIEVKDDINIYMPNSFTPNKDGYNDVITPSITGDIEDYHFYIFNRWGNTIFQTDVIDNFWDGTHDNTIVPNGIYTWRITYKAPNGAEIKSLTGFIMVTK